MLYLFQAVWFTAKQGIDGPVFGAQDQWNGMGLIFDSFDNDAQVNIGYVYLSGQVLIKYEVAKMNSPNNSVMYCFVVVKTLSSKFLLAYCNLFFMIRIK